MKCVSDARITKLEEHRQARATRQVAFDAYRGRNGRPSDSKLDKRGQDLLTRMGGLRDEGIRTHNRRARRQRLLTRMGVLREEGSTAASACKASVFRADGGPARDRHTPSARQVKCLLTGRRFGRGRQSSANWTRREIPSHADETTRASTSLNFTFMHVGQSLPGQ